MKVLRDMSLFRVIISMNFENDRTAIAKVLI